jgi:hypothetical protein
MLGPTIVSWQRVVSMFVVNPSDNGLYHRFYSDSWPPTEGFKKIGGYYTLYQPLSLGAWPA